MLKIGVLGVGHLGKIHLKCINLASESYELIGFYDPDNRSAKQAEEQSGARRWEELDALLDAVDVVDIVTPTTTHFEVASRAIRRGKHIFIEKPLTHTIEEAEGLLQLSREYGVKVQVGHVERFNPALLALGDIQLNPMFIEAHRLALFNPRGTDVSVILDLMIHDLDIILSLVPSEVSHISASGVPVVSDTADICNARIEFENGCVANLTASRISLKQMRKLRLFQQDAYISLDFLDKQAQVVRLFDTDAPNLPDDNLMELETSRGKKYLQMALPQIEPVNAIKMELETFAEAVRNNTRPVVNIEDGYRALKLAYQIMEEIERRNGALKK
ncbi:MAG TPA: Gfo/Idh/MocA family oxidoreductase [Saprospiraceae bacterium]|nr:Gfo/Idh/MocA family oxidoreductase [Lewinellaceae bacterium]HQU59843.1 Gfo/Idh/MocA family oxidoreductase [Saprospiraceae bacterium]